MKKKVGIYKITSPTGRVYIGQSWDILARWYNHGKSKTTPHLYASINKHGKEKHLFEIIHELPLDVEQGIMNEYEQLYMDLYRACGIKLLNIKEGGSNGKIAEESKRKISLSLKGRVGWSKGKNLSEEHRRKIGDSGRGKKASPKMIERLIKRNQQRKGMPSPFKGKKMTDEQKKRLSEAHKGQRPSPESIAKRTKTFLERLTPESRKRRSEVMKRNCEAMKRKKLDALTNQIKICYELP